VYLLRAGASGIQKLSRHALRYFPEHLRVAGRQHDPMRKLFLRMDVITIVSQNLADVLRRLCNPEEFEGRIYEVL